MNRRILKLAVPNIISNVSVPLLSMVDLAIAGHMGSLSYIGAIGVAGVIFNFIYWNFGFLRMGTTGFTAQALGARDLEEVITIMMRGILIALTISLILIILQSPILKFALVFIKVSPETQQPIIDYFYIRIWAAPCTLLLYVAKGWFIGMQNSRFPMIIAITVNVLNIIFSLLCVYTFKMGFKGIAVGTVIAEYIGLLLAATLWLIYYGKLRKYYNRKSLFQLHLWVNFFKVNSDIFLRTFCLIIVFTSFTSFSARFGDTVLAVNTLLMQLFTLFSYIMDGFAYAAESLTGIFVGAKNKGSLKLSIRYIFRWGWILTAFFTLIYFIWGEDILSLFTNEQTVLEASRAYFWWVLLIPISGFAAFLWDGIYVGATASKAMRNAIFIATAAYFLFYYGFSQFMGNNALWVSLLLFLLIRGLGMRFFAPKAIYNF